jgi:hypothetical protein
MMAIPDQAPGRSTFSAEVPNVICAFTSIKRMENPCRPFRQAPMERFGVATTHMRLPLGGLFFAFVTGGFHTPTLVGESRLITADSHVRYQALELYVLNTLIPQTNATWTFGDWIATLERTPCSYDLTRVSLPINEINLTHRLVLHRKDGLSFSKSYRSSGPRLRRGHWCQELGDIGLLIPKGLSAKFLERGCQETHFFLRRRR